MAYKAEYMKMAVKTAEKSRGISSPNPFVGAVIVKNDTVVGKGSSCESGKDHAEIVAIKMGGENCKGADMYVTLEPC
ncbi:MAG: deaminase, partial [Candidatus Cloacimonetes bacterium]|nr:deaminase [Candidatus Cloacimonadota bacterium]